LAEAANNQTGEMTAMIFVEEDFPVSTTIADLGAQLQAVRGGRDFVIDLLTQEADRRPFKASTIAFFPGGGIQRVEYICMATDEAVVREAVAELVGPGYIHVQPLPITFMSRECTVVDISALDQEVANS